MIVYHQNLVTPRWKLRARLVLRCLSFHNSNSKLKTQSQNSKLTTQISTSLKNCKTLVWTHISVIYPYNFFPKPWTPPTDTTHCYYCSYPRLTNKKIFPFTSPTHRLTFHFSDSPSFLSNFFVYLSFFGSPLFTLYLIFFSTPLFLSQLSLSLPSSICIWFFFSLFFVSFSAVFGWFESVVIGFKVVGCFSCFSGGDWVMGHGGDRVWLGFWVSVGVSVVICCDGLLWRRWVGLGLCFNGVLLWWCCSCLQR